MISIVMSAYNASATISKAIDSVRSQSLTDWELIIVDDASTDDTCNIILAYDDNRIKLINHSENLGAGLARRSGIEHIKGGWMTFLDSDDYISEEYLETLLFTINLFFKDKAPEAIDHKEFYRLLDTIKVNDIHGFKNEVNELYEYERCIKNIN